MARQITWDALAEKLGVSKHFIHRHRKKDGSPGDSKSVKKWEAYKTEVEAMRPSGRNIPIRPTKSKPVKKSAKVAAKKKAAQKPSGDSPSVSVGGKEYTAQDIINFKAKLTEEQGKGEEIKTKLKELELERERDQLVPGDEAKKVIAGILTPLRRNLDSMGRAICHRANPQDPILAEKAINEYIQHLFRGISEGDFN